MNNENFDGETPIPGEGGKRDGDRNAPDNTSGENMPGQPVEPAYNPFPDRAPAGQNYGQGRNDGQGQDVGQGPGYEHGQNPGNYPPEQWAGHNQDPNHPHAGNPYPDDSDNPYRQQSAPLLSAEDPVRGRSIRALTILSWFAVILITLGLFSLTSYMQLFPSESVGDASAGDLMQHNLQAKVLVGQQALAPSPAQIPAELNMGPPEARYCYSILLGEFESPESALDQLDETDDLVKRLNYSLSNDQKRLRKIVGELIESHDAGEHDPGILSTEDSEFLTKRLGFCGRLALYPSEAADSAGRRELVSESMMAMFVIGGAMLCGLAAGVAGLILAIIFFVRMASGSIRSGVDVPAGNGGVYIETFAIWMVMFIGLQFGMGFVIGSLDDAISMFVTAGIFFCSLSVLAWPVIRGIPFSQVCKDIGWRFKNPFVEGFLGGVSYVAMLPFMFGALICAVVIMAIMAQVSAGGNELALPGAQGHPIQEQIAQGNLLVFLGVFVTACIAAPIVEETMFRGVLYRHLRESSWRWGRIASIGTSAVVSSLIFAAIHPQGLFGIPILTTLAIGFSLCREWRDSLVGPMVMHAINNSMITCLLFVIM